MLGISAKSADWVRGELVSGRYQVLDRIGSDRLGVSVHVLDRLLDGRSLCLKIIHPQLIFDSSVFTRLQRKVATVRQLVHPGVVRVYDLDLEDGKRHYLVTEYVEGCNLDELRQKISGRRLPMHEALYILMRIAEAMAAAHDKKICHGDLSLENVLIGTSQVVKVGNFGLAQAFEASMGLTGTGESVAIPRYMAPERFDNNLITAEADAYSFGLLAFEILTGKLPFSANDYFGLAHAHQQEPINFQVLAHLGLPEWLIQLLRDCLAKDSSHRLASFAKIAAIIGEQQQGKLDFSATSETCVQEIMRTREGVWPKKMRIAGRCCWSSVVFLVVVATVLQNDAQRRVSIALMQIEQEFGLNLNWLHIAFSEAGLSLSDPNSIFVMVKQQKFKRMFDLVNLGVDINSVDDQGNSVTHYGILEDPNHFFLFGRLLNNPPNVNLRNSLGETPLIWAVLHDLTKAVDHLKEFGADPSIADNRGRYPLELAIKKRSPNMIRALGSYPAQNLRLGFLNNNGWPLIMTAVYSANLDVVSAVVAIGADVNARDSQGRSCLFVLTELNQEKAEEMAQLLLDLGADLEAKDNAGLTAFDYARQLNNSRLLSFLEPASTNAN